MRIALIALVCFVLGAAIALIARTALHDPYADGGTPPPPAPPAAPATTPPAEHQHAAETAATAATADNRICGVCGMEVDPAVPTASYHGKRIGFGCVKCPPKFAADPDRYGSAALQDRKAE
jgi:hypothetical protein